MKYIIELTNKQKGVVESLLEIVRRHIGFNAQLEPIENAWESELQSHYDRGLEDARQILLELFEMSNSERVKVFGSDDYYYTQIILEHFSIAEIKDRIKAYKEKNAEINDHHFIVDSLRNLIDDYGVEKIVKALPEFGIIAESDEK